MAYPGIVLLFGVGIGIALLYYVFSDNAHERSHAYSGNTRSPSSYDNWTLDRDRRYLSFFIHLKQKLQNVCKCLTEYRSRNLI